MTCSGMPVQMEEMLLPTMRTAHQSALQNARRIVHLNVLRSAMQNAAQNAMQELNGSDLDGRPIRVDEAEDKRRASRW